ncbi:hypothetical protein PASE110613_09410 [Paenibacillus sediminis]|uniref:Uncharacterized protein n=1 Tax=Paenibacillus sediminis TaxID=664909 RepID=A0ABS4H6G3_9BACL|nr:hypothetical protein [Paenibacillus sediminis]
MMVVDFTECPPRMFLFLADMAQDNPKLQLIWKRNYERIINGGDRHKSR